MIPKNSLFTEIETSKHYLKKHSDLFWLKTEFMKILFKFELMEVMSFEIKCLSKDV